MSEQVQKIIDNLENTNTMRTSADAEKLTREWENVTRHAVGTVNLALTHAADLAFGTDKETWRRLMNAQYMLMPDSQNPVMVFMARNRANGPASRRGRQNRYRTH